MKKILSVALVFSLVLPVFSSVEAAMYDDEGNRVYGRQNNMRNGTYDPRVIQKQFKTKRESIDQVMPRSIKNKRKYISCDIAQNQKQNYRLTVLKLRQGASRKCREDVRFIINIPYKTKSKKSLKAYEWKTSRRVK